MRDLFIHIREEVVDIIQQKYQISIEVDKLIINPTSKEFDGDFTVVVFPLAKMIRKSPEVIGKFLGETLQNRRPEIESFNVIKGFLNLKLTTSYWLSFLSGLGSNYGSQNKDGNRVMVEYSSPNTNKPLHLGHVRNILLGSACANILEACGSEVIRVQIINDRGIAICKSMLAWKKYANGATPESAGMKSDHLVGQYYIRFQKAFAEEYADWQLTDEASTAFEQLKEGEESIKDFFKRYENEYFNKYSQLGLEAREMLKKWESEDRETRELWSMMNDWVYKGFEETYRRMGVKFDKLYYESDTWQLGKEEVLKGLKNGKFYEKDDGSTWVDLTEFGMDHKILLRADRTSVYITQDIGTAKLRYRDFQTGKMVYVVGDEQNYHFDVLFKILKLLGEPYADQLFHLSYGMVDLPSGRMKSREGTVVDADDLISDVIEEAATLAREKGEIADLSDDKQDEIIYNIAMGALKFFILKVNPQKRMTFDPAASVDMQGQTGPYVQNAFVRIRSVVRKNTTPAENDWSNHEITPSERDLLVHLVQYPEVVQRAGKELDPSGVANYCYDLAKSFHRFYHEEPILAAKTKHARSFRIRLCEVVAQILEHGMGLLGIGMPERM
ncbi:MAG: arginine--tRNA ligase [Saprospiraceae bacterium]|nr:arginine--tRNA ligase [Saprospiraceae bacterium]